MSQRTEIKTRVGLVYVRLFDIVLFKPARGGTVITTVVVGHRGSFPVFARVGRVHLHYVINRQHESHPYVTYTLDTCTCLSTGIAFVKKSAKLIAPGIKETRN